EEGQAAAEDDHGDTGGYVIDCRLLREPRVHRSEQEPDTCCCKHTKPWRSGEFRYREGSHRAHQQDALHTQVDLAAFLGEALAETDEHIRDAAAHSSARQRHRYSPRTQAFRLQLHSSSSPEAAAARIGSART